MALLCCSACGKEVPDAATACSHCGKPVGAPGGGKGRRGLPVWGKILLLLLLGAALVGSFAAMKPSEAELRQAIRERGKELEAKGRTGPAVLIDDPHYAERFTYHDHFLSSEIKFTTDSGKVITVAHGQFGDISVSEGW